MRIVTLRRTRKLTLRRRPSPSYDQINDDPLNEEPREDDSEARSVFVSQLAARLTEKLYADGTGKPSKWWMSFQKRRFMNRSLGT